MKRGMRRVYQYGLLPPTENGGLVREQIRAAHDYANDLTAIERGRRWALRQVDDTPAVEEAVELLKAATKSGRAVAVAALWRARKDARDAAEDELARIKELDESIRRDARALTMAHWGTYLGVEAAHMQARQAPLYGDDLVTPSDPRFVRWTGVRPAGSRVGMLPESGEGQIGVQLQKGAPTSDVLRCDDTRVRLEMVPLPPSASRRMTQRRHAVLWLRVGSEGRAPVWAKFPLLYHRAVPDAAVWKWVRVSLRHEGRRERWSAEITVDDPSPRPRDQDRELSGVVAVEWEWSPTDEGIRVARWCDSRGGKGEWILPKRISDGIRAPDGHRAVRDGNLNVARPGIVGALRAPEEKSLPAWLAVELSTMHLWVSPQRWHRLHRRWHEEAPRVAPVALAMLDEWVRRDRHLWDYESGMRSQCIGQRRDWYRCLAAKLARTYKTAILSDQNLSREARWGPDADVRQTAGVYTLRVAMRNAFGLDALDGKWVKAPEAPESWCERARDAYLAGGARAEAMIAKRKEGTTNAWSARKAKAAERRAQKETVRIVVSSGAV